MPDKRRKKADTARKKPGDYTPAEMQSAVRVLRADAAGRDDGLPKWSHCKGVTKVHHRTLMGWWRRRDELDPPGSKPMAGAPLEVIPGHAGKRPSIESDPVAYWRWEFDDVSDKLAACESDTALSNLIRQRREAKREYDLAVKAREDADPEDEDEIRAQMLDDAAHLGPGLRMALLRRLAELEGVADELRGVVGDEAWARGE